MLIEVEGVTKEFKVYQRTKGFAAGLGSFFHRPYEIKKAVDDISFQVQKGETVAYIGANGAGKSTTIKILAGILVPTFGRVIVDGRVPYQERRENALHIGVVFGQRTHLHWDLPVIDSYELYQKMYRISPDRYRRNLETFSELLDLGQFIRKPVRQLSLGQKMRAELAAALLHEPELVYLDEPTIGLDVLAKSKIRGFIKQINRELRTTVILTTHDMDDIEQICGRLIMIDGGKILYDGSLAGFKERFGGEHLLVVDFADEEAAVDDPRLKLVKVEGPRRTFRFRREEITVAEAITLIARNYDITDLNIKEPEIEGIVKKIYENKSL
jgi:ABC-2 type transport system ATP-binding protein